MFAANLETANANAGPAISNTGYMTGVLNQLHEMKAIDVQAVTVEVSYPFVRAVLRKPNGLSAIWEFLFAARLRRPRHGIEADRRELRAPVERCFRRLDELHDHDL